MGEKVKQLAGKGKELLSKVNKKVRNIIIGVTVVTLAVILALVAYNATRPYEILFTGLSASDMSSILTYLDENSVTEYKVKNNDTILVPSAQVNSLKARVLQQNLPTSGFGYNTYFDNVGALSSESDRQTLFIYELNDRLAATIRCMDGVQDAVVNIAPGEDNRYILSTEDIVEASAWVQVTMEGGKSLTNDLGKAIQLGVANAVQGLQIDNITITDDSGNVYVGGDSIDASDSAALKLSLESQVNARLRNLVLQALVPMYGEDNVEVVVNSTVDVSNTYTDSLIYEEPDEAAWNANGGHGIINSWVYDNNILRGGDAAAGGVVGTSTNADLNEYMTNPENLTGDEQELGTSGEYHYDNTQHHVQSETPGGVVKDVMVAVTINTASAGDVNITSLIPYVARAAGISTDMENDKISIIAAPFYVQSPNGGGNGGAADSGLPDWAIYALIAGLALFLILLILILLVRRSVQKRRGRGGLEPEPMLEPESGVQPEPVKKGADIMDIHSERSMELRQEVRQFAEENPEIAAQMVKNWLKGGEDRG